MITTLLLAVSTDAAGKRFTLVIDAGHGGRDTGAKGSQVNEKTLTLRMALAFGRLVEQNCPDVNVIYTRKTDKFVELYRRAEIANQNKADLFISIHINALPKGKIARGFQTYTLGTSKRTGKKTGVLENLEVAKRENAVIFLEKDYKQTYHGYDPNSPESNIMFEFIQDKNMENSVELARYMQRYVCQATGRQDMGAQQDNLAVLRLTSMPGCLIELGFISTRDEEQYMNSSTATSAYARGIYNAFAAYKKRHSGQISVPYLPEPKSEVVEIPQIVPKQQTKKEKPAKQQEKPQPQQAEPKPQQTEPKPQPAELAQALATQESPALSDIDLSVVSDDQTSRKNTTTKQEKQPSVQEKRPSVQEKQPSVQEKRPSAQENQPSVKEVQPPVAKQETAEDNATEAPVFKIQILASSTAVKTSDKRFHGRTDIDHFMEGGMYKYTIGASPDYNRVYRLRKEILDKFPQAFIIAFRQNEKMDVQQAVREFRNRKVKR